MSIADEIKAAIDRTTAAHADAKRKKEQRQPTPDGGVFEITPGGSFDLGDPVTPAGQRTNLDAAGGYPPDSPTNQSPLSSSDQSAGNPPGDTTQVYASTRRYVAVRQDAADKLSMFTAKLDAAVEPVKLSGRAAPGQVNRITLTISPLGCPVAIADRKDKLNALSLTSFGAPILNVFQNAFIIPTPSVSGNTPAIVISTSEELWAQAVTAAGTTNWVSVLIEQFFADENDRGNIVSN